MAVKRMHAVATILLTCAVGACASASNPWASHAATDGLKAARAAVNGLCPVTIGNGTREMLDARYSVVGMDFDAGLIPVGQSVQFNVQCQAGRIQATAVTHLASLDQDQTRFVKTARLDPLRGARLDITPADRVH